MELWTKILFVIVLFLAGICVTANILHSFADAQTVSNITTIPPSGAGTPAITTVEPIATSDDLARQFNTLLATSGTGIAGGIGALWAVIRKKTKRIDSALRGNDYDHRDLMVIIDTFFETAKANPDKTPGQILDMPAYPDKKMNTKSLAQEWTEQFGEYDEWFTKRYVENAT